MFGYVNYAYSKEQERIQISGKDNKSNKSNKNNTSTTNKLHQSKGAPPIPKNDTFIDEICKQFFL